MPKPKSPEKASAKTADEFLSLLSDDRKQALGSMRKLLLKHDKAVEESVEPMMGMEMLIYKDKGVFKYGLASAKQYLSLHSMILYGKPELREKYSKKLPNAKFQKGCINFADLTVFPLSIAEEMFAEFSKCPYPLKWK